MIYIEFEKISEVLDQYEKENVSLIGNEIGKHVHASSSSEGVTLCREPPALFALLASLLYGPKRPFLREYLRWLRRYCFIRSKVGQSLGNLRRSIYG